MFTLLVKMRSLVNHTTSILLILLMLYTCRAKKHASHIHSEKRQALIDIFQMPEDETVASVLRKRFDIVDKEELMKRQAVEAVFSVDPQEAIEYYLFQDSRDVSDYRQLYVDEDESLESIEIDSKEPLKILIHGYMQDSTTAFPEEMKNAILKASDEPVLVVDWFNMSIATYGEDDTASIRVLSYPLVVEYLPVIGEHISDFIIELNGAKIFKDYSQLHIIGFGIGAHLAGIVGSSIQKKSNEKVGRITGLDPPGPKFLVMHEDKRLSEDDAEFVDVIHTSYFGYFEPIGHADFFPNGGKHQPGCIELQTDVTDEMASFGVGLSGSCSHIRAWQYYKMSLIDDELFACECDDDSLFKDDIILGCNTECKREDRIGFGEKCPDTARGTFYIEIIATTSGQVVKQEDLDVRMD